MHPDISTVVSQFEAHRKKSKSSKVSYPDHLKHLAIDLIHFDDRMVENVAVHLGIMPQTIRGWMKKLGREESDMLISEDDLIPVMTSEEHASTPKPSTQEHQNIEISIISVNFSIPQNSLKNRLQDILSTISDTQGRKAC